MNVTDPRYAPPARKSKFSHSNLPETNSTSAHTPAKINAAASIPDANNSERGSQTTKRRCEKKSFATELTSRRTRQSALSPLAERTHVSSNDKLDSARSLATGQIGEPTSLIIGQANDAHAKALNLELALEANLLAFVNCCRDTGIYLNKLREAVKHGEWMRLFRPNPNFVLNFTAETARRYRKLARAYPNKITDLPIAVRSLNDMLRAVEALPIRTKSESVTNDASTPDACLAKVSRLGEKLTGLLSACPPGEWEDDYRNQLEGLLRPIVHVYRHLDTEKPPICDFRS